MSDSIETAEYEVGYGKPPKSGQFKKGVSGNPSRRPKKPSDFASEVARELNSKVIIKENGKRKVIKKSGVVAKQLVNKAASGSVQAAKVVIDVDREARGRAAEQQQNSLNKRDYGSVRAEDLSDDELAWIIRNGVEKSTPDDANKPVGDRAVVAP